MNYSNYVSKAITYIQQHIDEEISLDKISEYVGYSNYHFHRLFKKETGYSLYDYIKQQRLIKASLLLKHSELSILDISTLSFFNSQEAFTRAFKNKFQIPPKKFRMLHKNIMNKGDHLMTNQKSTIPGWFKSGSASNKYDMAIDTNITHISNQSAKLFSICDDFNDEEFGTIMQQFKAEKFKGKRVKFSAFLKTELSNGSSGLWVRIDSKYYDMLAFDNMKDRLITESTDWNFYSCILDVPLQADVINIGILLLGQGTVWINSCQFQEVPNTEKVTELSPSHFVPDTPEHLDFS